MNKIFFLVLISAVCTYASLSSMTSEGVVSAYRLMRTESSTTTSTWWSKGTIYDAANQYNDRNHTQYFNFGAKFNEIPVVSASIGGLDLEHTRDQKVELTVYNISREGFSLNTTIGGNAQLYSIVWGWIAVGY